MESQRIVCDESKSSFEHTCNYSDLKSTRVRNYNTKELLAVPSPLKRFLSVPDSAESFKRLTDELGVPSLSKQVAGRLVLDSSICSEEQHVLEVAYLPSFLEQCRKLDPKGLYEFTSVTHTYNNVVQDTLQYFAASFGCAKELVGTGTVLQIRVIDAAHVKSIFGGVVFAVIAPLANRSLFPLMIGTAPAEDAASCLWFTNQYHKHFGDTPVEWIHDQGSGLLSEDVALVRVDHHDGDSLCTKHVVKALQVCGDMV